MSMKQTLTNEYLIENKVHSLDEYNKKYTRGKALGRGGQGAVYNVACTGTPQAQPKCAKYISIDPSNQQLKEILDTTV